MKLLREKKVFSTDEHFDNFLKIDENETVENFSLFEKMCENNCRPSWYDRVFEMNEENLISKEIPVELELTDNKIKLIEKLDNCQTIYGKYYLKKIMENPSSNLGKLKYRQQLLKSFIENNSEEITSYLNHLNKIGHDFLWFWKENSEHSDFVYQYVFYQNSYLEFLNKSDNFLLISNCYKIYISPFFTIVSPLVYLILPFIMLKFLKVKIPFNVMLKLLWKQSSMISIPFIKNQTINTILQYFSKFISIFFYFQNVYNTVLNSKNTLKIINVFQNKLSSIKKAVHLDYILKNKFNLLYDKNETNRPILDKIGNLEALDEEPKFISNKGIILSSFYEFLENKDCFLSTLHNIGIADAMLSITSLLNNKEKIYTVPTFLEDKKPTVNIKNSWHIALDGKKCVKNSINFDNKAKNYILTGPNAAGKSTFIKSIFLNIYLSQTIGVTNCDKIEFTPFKYMLTSIRRQDTQGVESLFESEVHKIKNHLDHLDSLEKKGHFSFSILDEIFTSTNYLEGLTASYSLCEELGVRENCLHVITTHYTNIGKIAKKPKYNFKNIHFEIEEVNGKIKFPYVLSEGISNQFIALKLMKEKNVCNSLVQNAINKLEKIKRKNKKSKMLKSKRIREKTDGKKTDGKKTDGEKIEEKTEDEKMEESAAVN